MPPFIKVYEFQILYELGDSYKPTVHKNLCDHSFNEKACFCYADFDS